MTSYLQLNSIWHTAKGSKWYQWNTSIRHIIRLSYWNHIKLPYPLHGTDKVSRDWCDYVCDTSITADYRSNYEGILVDLHPNESINRNSFRFPPTKSAPFSGYSQQRIGLPSTVKLCIGMNQAIRYMSWYHGWQFNISRYIAIKCNLGLTQHKMNHCLSQIFACKPH